MALGLALAAGGAWLWLAREERPGAEVAGAAASAASAAEEVVLSAPARSIEAERAPAVPLAVGGGTSDESDPGRSVKLRVVRKEDGQPLAGARVRVSQGATPAERSTDERGLCVLPVERAGECVPLEVDKEGFAAICGCFNLGEEHTFELSSARRGTA